MTNVPVKRKRVTISQQKASVKTTKLITKYNSYKPKIVNKKIIQNIPNEFLKFIPSHLFLLQILSRQSKSGSQIHLLHISQRLTNVPLARTSLKLQIPTY